MGFSLADPPANVDLRIAARLSALRQERGWTLEALAERTGISRATLSRLERGETSPTAALLGRLCSAHGRTMSRLLAEAEGEPAERVLAADQRVWVDPETGFRRRSVSPPHQGFAAEMIEGELPAGAVITYDAAPVAGLEHHLWMLAGALDLTVDGATHRLGAGDCLRYRLFGPTRFAASGLAPARYLLAMVRP